MRKIEYICNICEVTRNDCDELIGLNSDDDCSFFQSSVEQAEIHIRSDCFQELGRFLSNFKDFGSTLSI
jgi:hypothetical protein